MLQAVRNIMASRVAIMMLDKQAPGMLWTSNFTYFLYEVTKCDQAHVAYFLLMLRSASAVQVGTTEVDLSDVFANKHEEISAPLFTRVCAVCTTHAFLHVPSNASADNYSSCSRCSLLCMLQVVLCLVSKVISGDQSALPGLL